MSFRRIPSSHDPMESSKQGCRVNTMLVISFTYRLRTAMVSSIIVFGHATAYAMHTCKSERVHPSAIIFAFVERSYNAVLSRVLWSDVMVGCIKVAHRFGHPAAGAKRITSSPNQFVLYISLECRVFVL